MLLDIAIGPGPLSVPYRPLVSPASSDAGSSPILAPYPESSDVKEFNKEVDKLARHIKLLGNSIIEAGAVNDLQILEAKDYMERIRARLEHAVRIGGKKVRNLFDDDDSDHEHRQIKLPKFFLKAKESTNEGPLRSIFDEDGEQTHAVEA